MNAKQFFLVSAVTTFALALGLTAGALYTEFAPQQATADVAATVGPHHVAPVFAALTVASRLTLLLGLLMLGIGSLVAFDQLDAVRRRLSDRIALPHR